MVGLARVWSSHFSKNLPFEGVVTSIGKAPVGPTPKVTKDQLILNQSGPSPLPP